MRAVCCVSALLLIGSAAVACAADSPETGPTSIRPLVGAYLPTGVQRRELSSSVTTGVQLGYDLPIPLRLVGSVAWTPSHDRDFSDHRTNLYQYDAGLEMARRSTGMLWNLSPFVGAGLGARSYRLRGSSVGSAQNDFDGYGAVGGEVDRNRLGARIEVRDYVSRFKGIEGQEPSSTRNDVMLAGAITFHL